MKTIIIDLHKAFENRIRIGIMSVLTVNDMLDFNSLKNYLDATDGNLACHLKALEKEGFIGIRKLFVGKKLSIKFFMTKAGRKAFNSHLNALEKLIELQK